MSHTTEKQKGAAKTARIPIRVAPAERLAKPEWIRVKAPSPGTRFYEIKQLLRDARLHTVCEEASCPNCDVAHGRPLPPDPEEPLHLAQTIARLRLAYVVITSVDRDDLRDGGARHFVDCIRAVREHSPR